MTAYIFAACIVALYFIGTANLIAFALRRAYPKQHWHGFAYGVTAWLFGSATVWFTLVHLVHGWIH